MSYHPVLTSETLQAHTNYSGGYELTHPTITAFWAVVEDLSEEQKRALLKFVTSCSRPPLLGFKVSAIKSKKHVPRLLKAKYFWIYKDKDYKSLNMCLLFPCVIY